MKDNLIKIGPVLLTVVELLIAWVMLGLSDETVTVARAGGVVRAITDASPRSPRVGALLAETAETYEDCAAANKACEMLILAGVAEWANKTHSAIRATEGGREHKKDISNAYTKWQAKTAGLAWDRAVSTASLTESTVDPFIVGTLVKYKNHASRNTSDKRMGIIIAIDNNVAGHVASRRLVQVNWGSYGTFWDPAKNLEVVNASR